MTTVPFSVIDFFTFICEVLLSTKNAVSSESSVPVQAMSRLCATNESELVVRFQNSCSFLQSTDSLLGALEKPCALSAVDSLAAQFCRWWQNAEYPNVAMYQAFCPNFPAINFDNAHGMPREVAYLYLCKWDKYTKEYSPRIFEGADCDANSSSNFFVTRLRPAVNNCHKLEALIALYNQTNRACSNYDGRNGTPSKRKVCGWWNNQEGKLQEIMRIVNVAFCKPSLYLDRCGTNVSRTWFFHAGSVLSKTSTRLVYIIAFPPLLAISTVGNVISAVVFASAKSRKSAVTYLLVICICDLLFMWFQIPRYIVTVKPAILSGNRIYNSISGVIAFAVQTSKDISDWSLLVFTVERSMSICRPLQNRRQATARAAWIIVGVEAVVVIGINVVEPVAALYQYSRVETRIFELMYRDVPSFDSAYPQWIRNWAYLQLLYRNIKIALIFVILLIGDILVVIITRKRKRSLKANTHKSGTSELNVVTILSATTYLLTQSVTLINELLAVTYVACLLQEVYSYAVYWDVFSVQNALSDINHSCNILFYSVSANYRSAVGNLFNAIKTCNCTHVSARMKSIKLFSSRILEKIPVNNI
ncbi:uncharacterized protein LOC129580851 [Paramacrobiotus metropolitanus]|uniref:uncharacterized protein LOC129580851 n=1 Tax=Paramacrobiotus metropolitanus TaxID=2943436 RepID=UPI002445CD69|nr:uncharacterized protein LOC129580851 [Paramacrobiotus metropolitanus]